MMRRIFVILSLIASFSVGMAAQAVKAQPSGVQVTDNFLFDNMYLDAVHSKLMGDYNAAFDRLKMCRTLNPKSAAVLYEAATLLALSGNFEYAAQYAQTAVQIDTTANDNYLSLALQCLVKVGKIEETLPLYDTLIARRPDDADKNRLTKVALLQSLNKYDDAMAELDKVHADEPSLYIQTQVQRSLIYNQMGKKSKRAKILKKLVAKYPDDLQANFQYSRCLYDGGDYDGAASYCSKAASLPGGWNYLFVLADVYRKQKMDSLFAKTALSAYASPDIDISAKLGRIYDVLNRPDQMMQDANWRPFFDGVFYSLLSQYPDDAQVCAVAHNYYNTTSRSAKAFRLLTNFVKDNSGSEYIWRNILYYCQVELEQGPDTLAYYASRAAADMPEKPFFHLIYGQALQLKSDYDNALIQYKTAYTTYDANRTDEDANNRVFSMHGIAQCYTYLDSVSKAFAVYDQILSENDSDPVALNNYAYHLAQLDKDLSKAEKMSMKSLNIEPLNPTYLDTYAYILLKENKLTEAMFVMERCIEQFKESPSAEVLDHYGDILMGNGHADKALEAWRSALEKDPDNADIKKKIDAAEKL